MLPKFAVPLLIALLPVYIVFCALYLPASFNLSSILRLAKQTQLRVLSTVSVPQTSSAMSSFKIVPRRSQDRGHADHDWLKTFHTFSFAMYQGAGHTQFGSLRVINEDRVAPRTGFGTHSHREFEIFSYIVNGELEHKDSMGNTEVLRRGDIQMTSTGTGISHSEKTYGSEPVHFLQIWSLPSVSRLPPTYYTRHFTDAEKKDWFVRVVAPVDADGVSTKREDSGPAPVHSPLTLFTSLVSPSVALTHTFLAGPHNQRKVYIHVIQTSGYNTKAASGATIKVVGENGVGEELREGDGAYIYGESGKTLTVENVGDRVAEIVLFDLE